ncbi:MAG: RNA polymerase sigma factor [Crocinitomicaceae bacterium]|nr:RNA polymerase sigma factor [Crocinitomicaceae bacterium]
MDINKVIEECLKNDRRSQEQLFKLYYGKLIVVALRYISDRDTAEEILQNAFIKIFEKLEAYDSKGSFDGWSRRIVANTAIDYIRKSKKDPLLTGEDTDFVNSTVDPIVEREDMDDLSIKGEMAMDAIQQLSPAYRTVFNMFVLENYSHKNIAEKLGISEGTSKSNLAKAKANLKAILIEKFTKIQQ